MTPEQYRQLQDTTDKGTPEHAAYCCIVRAWEGGIPELAVAEIQRVLGIARQNLADNEQRNWSNRSGYRGYYNTKITILEQALSEITQEVK